MNKTPKQNIHSEKMSAPGIILRVVIFSGLMVASAGSFVHGQVSTWNEYNPYSEKIKNGDMVRIHVKDGFLIDTKGDWDKKSEMSLELQPDRNITPFLKNSEQSRVNTKKWKTRQKVSEKLDFFITGTLTIQADGSIAVNARKTIQSDDRLSSIVVSGNTGVKFIRGGNLDSSDISNLVIRLQNLPQPDRDTNAGLRYDQAQPDPNAKPAEGSDMELDEATRKRLVREYIQEVLGSLNQ